jgi:hypothetical protein
MYLFIVPVPVDSAMIINTRTDKKRPVQVFIEYLATNAFLYICDFVIGIYLCETPTEVTQ